MARARIGKLFHLTPLVDSLPDAEYFFNTRVLAVVHDAQLLVALAPPRRDLHHRRDVDRADALPAPGARRRGHELVPLRRALRSSACTTWRSTCDDLPDLAERLEAAGVRITDAGSGTTVFCHPKDTPGMLEFHPATGGTWENVDPRYRPEWDAFRDSYWPQHPLGVVRMSHITVVTGDLDAAEQSLRRRARRPAAARPGRDRRREHITPLPRRRGHRGRDDGPARHRHRRRPRPRAGRARRSPASPSRCATWPAPPRGWATSRRRSPRSPRRRSASTWTGRGDASTASPSSVLTGDPRV